MADLLIVVDREAHEPLHQQIAASIRDRIQTGRLTHGMCLPSSRSLAADLDISRGVVVEAYQRLTAEGYLSSRSGGYTLVTAKAAEQPDRPRQSSAETGPRIEFGYGYADPSRFPRKAWLRSVRHAVTHAPADRFNYLGGHGAVELRTAMADYLNRARGTAATADDILICNGYAQGIRLIIEVLSASGVRRLAVEDPSSSEDVRRVAPAAGMELVPVPVDDHGIKVSVLERSGAEAVIVTPSHQWPTGSVLSPERRTALLGWAARGTALIIEDDYDAEYRYDRVPLGSLQGLAPGQVVYTGSASKTLAPGLRLGWLILPGHLVGAVAEAKLAADRGSPVMEQLALADFLVSGEFERHLRRMRTVYRRRRDALVTALHDRLPALEPAGVSAGFHLIAWLPPGLDEAEVVHEAALRGVGIMGLGAYRIISGRPGLLFGYAGLDEQAIAEGVRILAEAVGACG